MNEFLEERVEEIVAAMKSNRYSHQVYIQLLEEAATGLMDEIHNTRMEELKFLRSLHTDKTRDGITFCTNCLDPDDGEYALYPCPSVIYLELRIEKCLFTIQGRDQL